MRRFALVGGVVLCSLTSSPVLVGQAGPPPLVPFRGLIDHVTRTTSGGVPAGNSLGGPDVISGDGRYVVFSSTATDLIAADHNSWYDVFLRDRMTGSTSRMSVADGGGESNADSWMAAISTNGRHVAFVSYATNLVPGDTNAVPDVFVRDLDANRLVRVSVGPTGAQSDGYSSAPSLSADGRFVVFQSNATTFGAGGVQNGPQQVYVHDRDSDGNGIFDEIGATTTVRASVAADGGPINTSGVQPRISADGRLVMFESEATNLVPPGYSNSQHHLYVFDRLSAQTALIDRTVIGGPSESGMTWGSSDMSDDGRFITFTSNSADIAPSAANGQAQVFRYDAAADPASATTVVSRRTDGALADRHSYSTTVSADGRYVGFLTSAANLAMPAPLIGGYAFIVADTADGSFMRADVVDGGIGFDGQYGFNPSLFIPSISADGTAIALASDAQNALGGAYSFGSLHMFVVTAFSAATPPAAPQEGGTGSIDANTAAVSGWDASVSSYDDWIVLTGGAGYAAGPRTLSYAVSPNPSGILRTGRIRVGSTSVTVRQAGDGDMTPPQITPIVTGTQGGDGWYTSNVTVSWTVSDPDSAIVNQSINCTNTIMFATDALYAPVTCEATSHGGTASQTVVIRRDTTAPSISITQPAATIYQNTSAMPSFSCDEPFGYAGVATCVGTTPQSGWLDTTPGRHTFTVTATDRAGNSSTRSVEYIAGPQACVTLPLVPGHVKGWWRFNGTLRDSITGLDAAWNIGAGSFQAAVVDQGWYDGVSANFLYAGAGSQTIAGQGLTVAAWVRPNGQYGSYGTVVSNPLQYHIARYPDGTLRWAFNTTSGFDWVNTGAQLPLNVWSHLAVTYKDGRVKSYVNGRLVHDAALNGTLTTSGNPLTNMTIGGRNGVTSTLNGTLDDLMIFDDALSATELDSLALSGSGSLCRPFASNLAVTAPLTIVYGTTFQVSARLTDASGRPLPNRNITVTAAVTPGYVNNKVTDANGSVTAQFPIDSSMTVGDYANAITATFANDGAFAAATARASVTLLGGTPPVTWPQPSSIVYGTALGAAQLNATSSLPGAFVYAPAAGTVYSAGTRILSVLFTPSDTAHWAERTVTRTLVVNKATPAVEISTAPLFYNGQPRQAAVVVRGVDGGELNPFTVLYNGAAALPVNAGTYAVQVSYAGSANYAAVTATGSLVINKTAPIMGTFGDITETYDGLSHGVNPSVAGFEGLLTPVVVTYNGSPTAPTNAGVYAIEARYDGSANYTAVSRTATLTILKAAPYLTWPIPPSITYGTPLGAEQLNASANVTGAFAYSPAAGTLLNAGSQTLTAAFTPADAANYDTATASRPLSVAKANAQVTWSAPAAIPYGTALGAAQLNATANTSGTFAYSPAAGTVLNAGTHVISATFTPDTANYNEGATAGVPLVVLKAVPAITWANPADIGYGTVLSGVQLNATAGAAGTFAYSPEAGTLLNAGSHTLSVTFTPAEAANYETATASRPLTVSKATPAITWPNPAGIVYGTALGAAQLNATASVDGTFTYSPAIGTVLNAGPQTLSVTFTPADAANYSTATAAVTLNVAKAAPAIMWPFPTAIQYGTPLGATQLNATAGVAGTFTYSPAAGAVLNAGSYFLSATFTPSDAANYAGATESRVLNVSPAPLVIRANDAGKPFGAPLPPLSAAASGLVNGDSMASLGGSLMLSTAATVSSSVGAYAITPSGVSSQNYSIVFQNGTLTISPASTVTSVAASPNPVGLNQPVTLTASVAVVAPGAGTPAGFVSFSDNGTLLGVVPVAGGTALLTTNGLTAGAHTILAAYTGDASFVAGSGTITLTVKTAAASSTTAVTSSQNPSVAGDPVTLTATVTAPSGVSGSVAFYDGATLLGSATVSGTTARLFNVMPATGGHAITARYLGNATIPPSVSPALAQYVRSSGASTRTSTTSLSASPSPAAQGSPITLQVQVVGSQNKTPGGTVLFMLNGYVLGQGTLTQAGGITAAVNLPVNGLPHGTHKVEAVYLGDATFRASKALISLVVN